MVILDPGSQSATTPRSPCSTSRGDRRVQGDSCGHHEWRLRPGAGDVREPDHVERLRVRFSDTDAGRIVHHSKLFRLAGRSAPGSFAGDRRQLRAVEGSGVHLPVTACSAEFRRAIRSEDEIEIALWLTGLSRARLEFKYEMRLNQAVAATARTTHALVNDAGGPSAWSATRPCGND